MTRQEKIDEMIKTVENWDISSLIDHFQYDMGETFNIMSDAQIDAEFLDGGFVDDDEAQECDEKDCEECCTEECRPAKTLSEELCGRCKRMKDVGQACWNCGCK